MSEYLQNLQTQLAEGVQRLPAEFRDRQTQYFQRSQNPDGGFSGREGESDLYYTGFALRSLAVLDGLTPLVAEQAATFLRDCLTRQTSVVDFFSFLYSCLLIQVATGQDVLESAPVDWPERVAATLDSFRTPDGGYNKSPGAKSGSTYHTFLVGLCFQLLGRGFPHTDSVLAFVRSRQRDDGGFVEVAAMRRSGTNPTAAGIGILQIILGESAKKNLQPTIDFLAEMTSDEGGLRANDRVPLADLLSTFTGCWSLETLGSLSRVNRRAVRQFAESLQRPEGGFLGGLWDERTDVEYSFYGLGVLALMVDR